MLKGLRGYSQGERRSRRLGTGDTIDPFNERRNDRFELPVVSSRCNSDLDFCRTTHVSAPLNVEVSIVWHVQESLQEFRCFFDGRSQDDAQICHAMNGSVSRFPANCRSLACQTPTTHVPITANLVSTRHILISQDHDATLSETAHKIPGVMNAEVLASADRDTKEDTARMIISTSPPCFDVWTMSMHPSSACLRHTLVLISVPTLVRDCN